MRLVRGERVALLPGPGNEASVEGEYSFFFACTQGRSSKKSFLGKCLQQVRGMRTILFCYKLLSKPSLLCY